LSEGRENTLDSIWRSGNQHLNETERNDLGGQGYFEQTTSKVGRRIGVSGGRPSTSTPKYTPEFFGMAATDPAGTIITSTTLFCPARATRKSRGSSS
jgi:hypothetical protein